MRYQYLVTIKYFWFFFEIFGNISTNLVMHYIFGINILLHFADQLNFLIFYSTYYIFYIWPILPIASTSYILNIYPIPRPHMTFQYNLRSDIRARSVGCSKIQPVLCHTFLGYHSLHYRRSFFILCKILRKMPKNRKIDTEYLATRERSIISQKLTLAVNQLI